MESEKKYFSPQRQMSAEESEEEREESQEVDYDADKEERDLSRSRSSRTKSPGSKSSESERPKKKGKAKKKPEKPVAEKKLPTPPDHPPPSQRGGRDDETMVMMGATDIPWTTERLYNASKSRPKTYRLRCRSFGQRCAGWLWVERMWDATGRVRHCSKCWDTREGGWNKQSKGMWAHWDLREDWSRDWWETTGSAQTRRSPMRPQQGSGSSSKAVVLREPQRARPAKGSQPSRHEPEHRVHEEEVQEKTEPNPKAGKEKQARKKREVTSSSSQESSGSEEFQDFQLWKEYKKAQEEKAKKKKTDTKAGERGEKRRK